MHTAIDAIDARALAEFYRQLLGLHYRPGDEPSSGHIDDDADWLVLVDAAEQRVLAIQEVPALSRPTWFASHDVPKQLHVDFRVSDVTELETSRARAESLGATLLLDRSHDADEPLYALADPEGHPFCLLVAAE